MSLRLAVLKNVFNTYSTRAYPLIFFFLAVIYFILKEKKEQRNLLIYEIFGILLLVTPFIGNKIVTIKAGTGSNWPVYGILCVIPLTAYVAVDMLKEQHTKQAALKYLVLLFVTMQLGFGVLITGGQLGISKNLKKTSDLTLKIAENLDAAKAWSVMAPKRIAGELRRYNDAVRVFYREDYEEIQKNIEQLQKELAACDCNCVIVEVIYEDEEEMNACGYSRLAETDGYVIYIKNNL